MKHFPHYDAYPLRFAAFEEAVGTPDHASSAIGFVAIKFSWLEEALAAAIGHLLHADAPGAAVVAAETSFRAKVNILAALLRLRHQEGTFTNGWSDPLGAMAELTGLCFRAEEYRNQVMHSLWSYPHPDTGSISRTKNVARGKMGYRSLTETMTPNSIVAIAEFISNVHFDVDDFFGLSAPRDP